MRKSVQIIWEVCFGLPAKNTQSRNSDSHSTTGGLRTVGSNRADGDCAHSVDLPFSPNPLSSRMAPEKAPKHRAHTAGGEMFSEEREPVPAGAEAMIW